MTSLSTDSGVAEGCVVEAVALAVDYGVAVTGSAEEEILYYREVNSGLWIWSENVTDPSWEYPSPHTHGCKRSHPMKRK